MKLISSPTIAVAVATTAVTFLITVLPFQPVYAFPSGAGQCPPDIAAVGTPHLNTQLTITTGTLEDAGLEFVIDGTSLVDGAVLDVANDGTPEHTVDVTGTTTTFKGFLIRAQSLLGDDLVMAPGTNAQEAAVCSSPAVGVTHTSKDTKTDAGGTLVTASTDSTVVFDITVVVSLENGISEYYYSQYTVNFGSNDTAPVASPVSSPVSSPASSPVSSPVVATPTTEAPAVVPTPAVITTTPPTVDDANTPPAPAPTVPTSNEVGAPTDAPTSGSVGGPKRLVLVLAITTTTMAACLVAVLMV